jgi:hypothetical protein
MLVGRIRMSYLISRKSSKRGHVISILLLLLQRHYVVYYIVHALNECETRKKGCCELGWDWLFYNKKEDPPVPVPICPVFCVSSHKL